MPRRGTAAPRDMAIVGLENGVPRGSFIPPTSLSQGQGEALKVIMFHQFTKPALAKVP